MIFFHNCIELGTLAECEMVKKKKDRKTNFDEDAKDDHCKEDASIVKMMVHPIRKIILSTFEFLQPSRKMYFYKVVKNLKIQNYVID